MTPERSRAPVHPSSIASYVHAIRPVVDEAAGVRASLVAAAARTVDTAGFAMARNLRGIGRTHRDRLLRSRAAMEALRAPPECRSSHEHLERWIAELVLACDALARAGLTPDRGSTREAYDHLARARLHASRFNGDLGQVVDEARRTVRQLRRQRLSPLARSWSYAA
jgi:hypothetical protein